MGNLIMSKKEREQVKVFELITNKAMTQKAASIRLNMTTRGIRKKFERFKKYGDRGLIHASRGRLSRKRWSIDESTIAINLLRNEWKEFGPTFAAEKLKELHSIKISKETLRQNMIKNGLWSPKKNRFKHRVRRQRRMFFGVMTQLDGSPHDWFEGRGPRCTLLVFIDDATSKIVWLEFVKSESTKDVMQAMKKYILSHGIPREFYVDYGSVFSVNTNNPDREKITQWERCCKELGIDVIHARSPQAKGRVERANRTLQDRLIKEFRLKNISSIDGANLFVQNDYIHQHNQKFAVQATLEENVYRSIDGYNLKNIFCLKDQRIIQNDFTISYKKLVLQLHKDQKTIIRPKNQINVFEHFDGSIKLFVRKTEIYFSQIKKQPIKIINNNPAKVFKHFKSALNHPLRQLKSSIPSQPGRVG